MVVLKVEDLHVRYGSYEAVKGVSFDLKKGEILGIVGESGSGKSTIAKTLIGLQKASSGGVVFSAKSDNQTIKKSPPSVQMIFQDAVGSLNPRMTVRQTLEEVLRHSRNSSESRNSRRSSDSSDSRDSRSSSNPRNSSPSRSAPELLELVGLSSAVLDQYPREMSGGQCQRVSVARALACRPDILIADEPVSALDVSVQARILNLLRDLRRDLGLTILLIAHDLSVVKNVCDRIAVMERGLFVDFGEATRVFDHPESDYTKRLLAAVPDVARALSL